MVQCILDSIYLALQTSVSPSSMLLQKDVITYFKLQRPSSFVSIAFLPALVVRMSYWIFLIVSVVPWISYPMSIPYLNHSSTKGVLHFLPYRASKESILMLDWWLLLYESSTEGKSSPHFPRNSNICSQHVFKNLIQSFSFPFTLGW